jgi:hypothetical protein
MSESKIYFLSGIIDKIMKIQFVIEHNTKSVYSQ